MEPTHTAMRLTPPSVTTQLEPQRVIDQDSDRDDNCIPLLDGDDRDSTFPIKPGIRRHLFELYKKAANHYWTVEEVKLIDDVHHYTFKLTDSERWALNQVLGFFAIGDKLVNVNIINRFRNEIAILEVQYFFDFQIMIENIHAEMYSLLVNTLIPDEKMRNDLFQSTKTMPVVRNIATFIMECVNSNKSLQERLFIMSCVEGILFVGCFCFIFWLQERDLLPGLAQSNELISIDENLHKTNGLQLVMLFKHALARSAIEANIARVIGLADELTDAMFPPHMKGLLGMNSMLMKQYLRFVADKHIADLNERPIFSVENPFQFMIKINLRNKTDFFWRTVTEYSKQQNADTLDYEQVDTF